MRRIRDESKKLLAQERQLRLNDIRLRGADSGAGAVGFVGEGGPSESAASSSVSKRAWADTALGVLNDLLRLAFKIHSPDWRQQVCVCVCVCAGVCMRFRLAVILVNGSSMLASRIELRTMHENARKKSAHSLSRTHARSRTHAPGRGAGGAGKGGGALVAARLFPANLGKGGR